MLFVVLCFLVLSRIYPLPADLRRAALVLGAVAVLGFVVLLVASRNRPRAERMLDVVVARLPAAAGRVLRPLAMGFLDALGALESAPHRRRRGGLLDGAVGGERAALPLRVPRARRSTSRCSPRRWRAIVIVAAFVFMPQAPGFLGTWQAGCVLALDLFGVPKDMAVGFSLLTWVVQMLVNVPLGGCFASREDVSWRQLVRGGAPAPAAEGES